MNMLKSKEKENALNEIRLLASIQDKYIISYKDVKNIIKLKNFKLI